MTATIPAYLEYGMDWLDLIALIEAVVIFTAIARKWREEDRAFARMRQEP